MAEDESGSGTLIFSVCVAPVLRLLTVILGKVILIEQAIVTIARTRMTTRMDLRNIVHLLILNLYLHLDIRRFKYKVATDIIPVEK